MTDVSRVAPVLKEQIDGGKINLTAIVNTHQYVLHEPPDPINLMRTDAVIGTTPEETRKLYDHESILQTQWLTFEPA